MLRQGRLIYITPLTLLSGLDMPDKQGAVQARQAMYILATQVHSRSSLATFCGGVRN